MMHYSLSTKGRLCVYCGGCGNRALPFYGSSVNKTHPYIGVSFVEYQKAILFGPFRLCLGRFPDLWPSPTFLYGIWFSAESRGPPTITLVYGTIFRAEGEGGHLTFIKIYVIIIKKD